MFDRDRFIEECRAAVTGDDAAKVVRQLLARAVSEPDQVIKELGAPVRGEIQTIYRADDLTILNVIWGPHMTLAPHNHHMWAVIGMYTGREDNIFWRRTEGLEGRQVEAAGAAALCTGDVAPLGPEVIHSVTNPLGRLAGAIHVYGGDFFAMPRSQWDADTLVEGPYDMAANLRVFEESNAYLSLK